MFDFIKKKKPEVKTEKSETPETPIKPDVVTKTPAEPDKPKITWEQIVEEADASGKTILPHGDKHVGRQVLKEKGLFFSEEKQFKKEKSHDDEVKETITEAVDRIVEGKQLPKPKEVQKIKLDETMNWFKEIGKSLGYTADNAPTLAMLVELLTQKHNELKDRVEKLEQQEDADEKAKKKTGHQGTPKKGKKNR